MGSNFFTYEYDLPQDVGFGIFGVGHILWLLVLVALSAGTMRRYARLSERKRRVWEYVTAFSLVGLIVLRSIYVAAVGASFLYELPLHLCSVTGILCAFHCVTGADWMGQVLYAIGLPGRRWLCCFRTGEVSRGSLYHNRGILLSRGNSSVCGKPALQQKNRAAAPEAVAGDCVSRGVYASGLFL